MRGKTAEEVVSVQFHAGLPLQLPGLIEQVYTYSPVVGTEDVPGQPLDLVLAGKFGQDKAVMLGDTRNDARQFIYEPLPEVISPLEYEAVRVLLFGNWSQQVQDYYPLPGGVSDARDHMSLIGTEYVFRCSNRAIARGLADHKAGGGQVYLYTFDHPLSFDCWGKNFTFCWMNSTQVCHGSELPLLFGSADFFYKPTEAEHALEDQLRAYWSGFAHGRVNSASGALLGNATLGAIDWPAYSASTDLSMSLDIPLEVQRARESEVCDGLWDKAGYTKF